MFVMGIGVALNGPAYQTVLSELVPHSEQQNAVLLYYMGLNITRVIGPAVGGFVLGFSGAENAFYINAACFWDSFYIIGFGRCPTMSRQWPQDF